MPKASTKVQRRIAELDAKRRTIKRALVIIILALIAVAAFSYAHRTTSDFVQLTLKQGPTTPKRQISDAEAQAKSNAVFSPPASHLR